jgi:hypothetical protein
MLHVMVASFQDDSQLMVELGLTTVINLFKVPDVSAGTFKIPVTQMVAEAVGPKVDCRFHDIDKIRRLVDELHDLMGVRG